MYVCFQVFLFLNHKTFSISLNFNLCVSYKVTKCSIIFSWIRLDSDDVSTAAFSCQHLFPQFSATWRFGYTYLWFFYIQNIWEFGKWQSFCFLMILFLFLLIFCSSFFRVIIKIQLYNFVFLSFFYSVFLLCCFCFKCNEIILREK